MLAIGHIDVVENIKVTGHRDGMLGIIVKLLNNALSIYIVQLKYWKNLRTQQYLIDTRATGCITQLLTLYSIESKRKINKLFIVKDLEGHMVA
jgi:hypothetical protein